MIPHDIAAIRATRNIFAYPGAAAVRLFYDTLFLLAPEARRMSPQRVEDQADNSSRMIAAAYGPDAMAAE